MLFRQLLNVYERLVQFTLSHPWPTLGVALFILIASGTGYTYLKTDFLPHLEEGGFIIDYISPPGTSLEESDRELRLAEKILSGIPEVESYSRRTGTALGVHLDEPNTGDFLVKLKSGSLRASDEIIKDLRRQLIAALPRIDWEFPGILTDLIGDLTWEDQPIEIKVFSTDQDKLKSLAFQIEEDIEDIPGVVDVFNGLAYTGPSIHLNVRNTDAERFGLTASDIADAMNTAMLGKIASTVVEGDRVINIRVKAESHSIDRVEKFGEIPIRAKNGHIVRLDQVTDITINAAEMELHRDDQRQEIAVTAGLEHRDLGSAMKEIRRALARDPAIPMESIEFGGLYEQQQESFRNLTIVLITALVLVFTVALLEFRSFREPIAIVFGAALSVFGIIAALLLTGTTLNIVTFLGAIIGMGIVHKNGLLMLDSAKAMRGEGVPLLQALIQSGRRRLRPVLMTSLAAALGMLPLAWGYGSAQMLRPLAIPVIGAVLISVLLSLIATPTIYFLVAKPDPVQSSAH